jgi:hypothetical protein
MPHNDSGPQSPEYRDSEIPAPGTSQRRSASSIAATRHLRIGGREPEESHSPERSASQCRGAYSLGSLRNRVSARACSSASKVVRRSSN